MHILGREWKDGYLDEHRGPGALRVAVRAWWNLLPVRDVFLEQPRSVQRVLNYVREVGVVQTLRKVRSRLAERLRDWRFLAVSLGEVLEADPGCTTQRRVRDRTRNASRCSAMGKASLAIAQEFGLQRSIRGFVEASWRYR